VKGSGEERGNAYVGVGGEDDAEKARAEEEREHLKAVEFHVGGGCGVLW
jgi:hypothetical protein